MELLTLYMVVLTLTLFIMTCMTCILIGKSKNRIVQLLTCLTVSVAVATICKIVSDIISLSNHIN